MLATRSVSIDGIGALERLQGLATSAGPETQAEMARFAQTMGYGVDLEVVGDDGVGKKRIELSEFLGARDLTPRLFTGDQARSKESFVDGPVLDFADALLGRQPDLLRGLEFTREVRPINLPFTANPSFAMFYGVLQNSILNPDVNIGWEAFKNSYLLPYGRVPSHILEPGRHYGLQLFEGLKVYIQPDGSLALFRPGRNAVRMAFSAERLVMHQIPEDVFISIAKRVARANSHLLPAPGNGAGYLRPVLWGSGHELGVRAPAEVALGMTCNPVGPYFAGPLGLVVQDQYMRSGPKLTGKYKVEPNYAGSIKPARDLAKSQEFSLKDGKKYHFSEILYTDANGNFQEAGAANIFFILKDGRIVTPPLNDQILPGITRDSSIQILRDLGFTVDDQNAVNISQLMSGDIVGAFATGTAAVVSSISVIRVNNQDYFFSNDGSDHPIAARLQDQLTGIQSGRIEDRHGWMVPI